MLEFGTVEGGEVRILGSGVSSSVEFQKKKTGLLEKTTIKQKIFLSYTEFSEENENDPCQVVYFGKQNYAQFLIF